MSNLKITTRTHSPVNPLFVEQFLKLVNDDDTPVATLRDELPLLGNLDSLNHEQLAEINDIYCMTEFMLSSGSLVGYRGADSRFYFGDIDLMDMVDSYTGLTVIQHELDDNLIPANYGNVDDFIERNFKKVYKVLKAANGVSPIPFSDTEYYSTMLTTHMGMRESDAAAVALALYKFDAFLATCIEVDNVGLYTTACNDDTDQGPGRIYCESLGINSTMLWDKEIQKQGAWYLQIENCQYQSDDLEDLELELFLWALAAGYCDEL